MSSGLSSIEEKIRYTIAEYCHRTDQGDFDGWVALFTEDGVFRMPGVEVTGREALRAFIGRDQPAEMRGLHLVTDIAITLNGDNAEVRSNFLFVAGGDAAAVVVTGGRYLDVLVPVGDGWLFKLRETELILPVATQPWGSDRGR